MDEPADPGPAPQDPPQPVINPAQDAHANYFVRHWRGALPLGTSYWLNLVLPLAPVQFFFRTLNPNDATSDPRPLLAALMVVLPLTTIVYVWGIVGTWRSASNHIHTTGLRVWARTAQIVIGVGAPLNIITFAGGTLFLVPLLPILLGTDRMDTATVTQGPAVGTLRVAGPIGFGTADRVITDINRGDIQRIVVNSLGGRAAAGLRVGKALESHPDIEVIVDPVCASACVLLLAGATNRVLMEKAHVAFHRPALRYQPEKSLQHEIEVEKTFLRARGFTGAIVDKGYDTPNQELYVPKTSELLDAGVITRVLVNGRELNAKEYAEACAAPGAAKGDAPTNLVGPILGPISR